MVPDPRRIADTAAFLADAIDDGKRIVLLAGFGAIRAGANREVLDFVERYQIPLITTIDGKGIVDEEPSAGDRRLLPTAATRAPGICSLTADVVIGLGNSFAQHATFDFHDDLFENRKLVHIDIDPNQIDKVYKADRAIVGDARLAISALADALAPLGRVPPKTFRAPDFDAQRVVEFTPSSTPARWCRRSRATCRRAASCWPTPAPMLAWLRLLPRAQGRTEFPQARHLRADGDRRVRRDRRQVRRWTAPWSPPSATAAT